MPIMPIIPTSSSTSSPSSSTSSSPTSSPKPFFSSPPSPSPSLPPPTSDPPILTTNGVFTCAQTHRTLLLRGVNLSGSSKAPLGYPSHILDDFWEAAERGGESFIGQPLDIDDGSADVHLQRLKGWGFNLLRFPVSWESLERMGPKKYDYEYMDYIIRVLCKCREYGFKVFIDPHQDTWSRFSGGSGAPYWTLAACGINPANITATQASIIHSEYPLPTAPAPATLPAMIWSTNYGRLLCQTVFTLFFAGAAFAPHCIIDGLNIQHYLQSHFIESFGRLADRIKAFQGGALYDATVIGWDSLNEPYEGLCGWFDLNKNPTAQGSTLKKGTYPTPAQSMRLGMGIPQTVEHWSFGAMGPKRDGSVTIDPKGRKLWAEAQDDEDSVRRGVGEGSDGVHRRWGWRRDVARWKLGMCPWALHGVWDVETGYMLEPLYFVTRPGTTQEVEFIADYWKPHFIAYTSRIRSAHQDAILFVQPPVFARPPEIEERYLRGRAVYAPHYYDGFTLITKHWNWFNADALGMLRGKYRNVLASVKVGEGAIRKSFREQLGYLKEDALILTPDEGDEQGGEGGEQLGEGDDGDGDGGEGARPMPKYPTVIGEIGTPFDMDNKKAYGYGNPKAKGDYSSQEKALDASLNAADGVNGLSWTVWTYVGVVGAAEDGAHSHEWGDGWNGEDLSLWSGDDVGDEWGEWELDVEGDVGVEGGLGGGGLKDGVGVIGGYDAHDAHDDDVDDLDEDMDGGGGRRYGAREMIEAADSRDDLLSRGRAIGVSRQPSARSVMKLRPWNTSANVNTNNTVILNTSTNTNTNTNANTNTNPNTNTNTKNTRKTKSAAASEISLPTLGGATSSSITANSIRTRASAGSLKPGVGGVGIFNVNANVKSHLGRGGSEPASPEIDSPDLTSSSHTHTHTSSNTHAHSSSHSSLIPYKSTSNPTYKPTTPERLAGYASNPLLFLTNGARAYRAFIRPYPMRTVGRVISVDFDIGKASVRVVVGVVGGVGGGMGGGGGQTREQYEDQEQYPTEIFVPLVHYAHPRLLEGLFDDAAASSSSGKPAKSRPVSPVGVRGGGHERVRTDTSTTTSPDTATATAPDTATATATSTNTAANSAPASLRNRKRGVGRRGAPDPVESGEEPVVDVDVWVSAGRWEVRGQVLRWWYEEDEGGVGGGAGGGRGVGSASASASASARTQGGMGSGRGGGAGMSGSASTQGTSGKETREREARRRQAGAGTGEKEYTIEIKRRGGPMKGLPERLRKRRREIERAAMAVGMGEGENKERRGKSVCERLCPAEGCVVM